MARRVVKILGQGCGSCAWTERLVRSVIAGLAVDAEVEKVTETSAMIAYGVRSSPAVVLDGRVVHAGGIPTRAAVESWFAASASS
jgi:small redox-active disulfide protein 2